MATTLFNFFFSFLTHNSLLVTHDSFVENKGVPRRDAFGRTLFDLLFPFHSFNELWRIRESNP